MSMEMKYSGNPWIGYIPKGWNTKRLKFSCKLFGRIGFRGYTADDLVDESEGAITLSPTNMNGIKLDFSKCSYLSWNKYYESPEIMVETGDVLLVKTASVGKCSYVECLPKETTVNPQILVLKEHKDCSKFIAYLFQTSVGEAYIDTTKGGSTIYTISQEKIGNYEFAFPSIAEQHKITSFLDRKCAEIDEMIALQEKIVEELKAYKQSVITEAVTKGLNPDVPMKDSGIEWIGEIPERWSLYRIKYNTFLKGRIGWQGLNSNDFIDEGYCLITGTDFDNKGGINWDTCYRISKERFDEDELLHIKNGDLLMTKDGTVGKMAYIQNLPEEASLNSHLLIIRQTTNIISNEFLYWVMLSNVFKRFCSIYQSGSIMSSISQSTLGMMSCYCPSIEEQNSIVTYLKTKCTEIDSLINIKLSKIDSLKEYKKSIIYEYVTGKKEITE